MSRRLFGDVDPDQQLHAFRTFLGIPPDSSDPPACGATLTSAYDGRGKPHCPECDRQLAIDRRRQEARDHARCMRNAFHEGPCSRQKDPGAVVGSCARWLTG